MSRGQAFQAIAAEKANDLWDGASQADPGHPVLVDRKISPHGMRQLQDTLLVPLYRDPTLTPMPTRYDLVNLLHVFPEGFESLVHIEENSPHGGTRRREIGGNGLMVVFSRPEKPEIGDLVGPETEYLDGLLAGVGRVYACAGWLEASTLHEITQRPVVGAWKPADLPEIVKSLRKNLPDTVEIVVVGEGEVAEEAAFLIRASRIVPSCGCCETFADAHLKHLEA
ncbi:hypothetical protein DFP85_12810 [Halomonas ventosae]|uniref:Uncharacterized protein n=1 Tax=Halomonas ventosae TaxID=229007 RepID=A0A4R6ZE31_9GAMM|nr:hypothetical protein [Halomonas ventosae]TDR50212.1 hypothetical protein DFP85_12810 [Halomonas ventosae]